jgi:hypothetical protein
MESVQRIVVRAGTLRRRLPTRCAIEHLGIRHDAQQAVTIDKRLAATRESGIYFWRTTGCGFKGAGARPCDPDLIEAAMDLM